MQISSGGKAKRAVRFDVFGPNIPLQGLKRKRL